MKNKDLKKFYDGVYKRGERKHYSKLLFGEKITEEKKAILGAVSWKGKRVLDIGCGTGELAFYVAQQGADEVVGIDYSPSAITVAKDSYARTNLMFECMDVSNISGTFDVITIVGVLEHIDEPLALLHKAKKLLRPKGSIIVTCPNWSNPRGYILQTLRFLFGARVTLVDIHYFTPVFFLEAAKKLSLALSWRTIERSWGHGEKMLNDLEKRLPNVLKDIKGAKKAKDIEAFIAYLKKEMLPLEKGNEAVGATGFYHFTKGK